MTTLIDYILDLFRSPDVAAAFVADPDQAMRDAGLPNVSAAQLASVAASVAPAGVALGNGDPVYGLQSAVSSYHSFASPFSPQTSYTSAPTFAPQTDFASHNSTDFASHNDVPVFSPNQDAGANAQQGAFNLGFGDITLFGSKTTTTTTATNGGVVVDGTNTGTVTTGHDNTVGDGNTNVHDVLTGSHSPVIVGAGNQVHDSSQTAGGDVISHNSGPVIKDVDTSGGNGGGASAGGGILGGGHASGGSGGSGGSIVINDSHGSTNVDSGNTNVVDSSSHTATTTSTTTTVSGHSTIDSSVHADSSVHEDSSVHTTVTDESVHQAGGINTYADTDLHNTTTVEPHTAFHAF
ncbi:IniB N-terminal domain-containing protein [Mycolicibacterium sp. 120266]|uniref:IniB N-terminal domain-containing protein n=1 Tax=Mycolicibacterium sp. 120266 TaxID=3090601 RepID=UPI00299D9A4E|nr:IniB N-terminal domain-containing protein [Mycolicibacterium sp. 120266]MDX1871859.1 IniB N-terminal domain-containing protein [Mycolicibacterium sp. 120266]